jgi:hypothetical protein
MGQGDNIGCSFPLQGIDFYGPLVQLYDFKAQGHTDAMPGSIVLVLSPVERPENLFLVLFRDTDTIVCEPQDRFLFPVRDMDGRGMVRGELAIVFY